MSLSSSATQRATTPVPPSSFSPSSLSSSSSSACSGSSSSQSLSSDPPPNHPTIPSATSPVTTVPSATSPVTTIPRTTSPKMTLYPLRLYNTDRPPALTSTVAPPSLMHTTAHASTRKPAGNLRLSALLQPSTTSSSSPRTPPVLYSYAHSLSTQQKLQLHQREIINSATRASGIPQHLLSSGPLSPRLIPLGSPGGPVTPLMLEQEKEGSYFVGMAQGVSRRS